MNERPILFSTAMVKAILEGRKTQTRRIVAARNSECTIPWDDLDWENVWLNPPFGLKVQRHPDDNEHATVWRVSPRIQPGDRLYVRETWAPKKDGGIIFKADADWGSPFEWIEESPKYGDRPKWKSPYHMVRSAARIWLEVESVGVERLQEISEQDAWDEGIECDPTGCSEGENGEVLYYFKNYLYNDSKGGYRYVPAIDSYRSLWTSINGPESWEQNPFVWVIKFKRIEV